MWKAIGGGLPWKPNANAADPRLGVGQSRQALDETLDAREVRLDAAAAALSLDHTDLDLELELALLASAYLAGIAEATTSMSVNHAKTREQFGKPIGTFQAIKHHCANMATQANAATSLNLFAALTVRNGGEDAPFQVAASQLIASRAALFNATLTIQVHGAMGFTAECFAHFCVKRSHLMNRLSGGQAHHGRRLLETRSPFAAEAAGAAQANLGMPGDR